MLRKTVIQQLYFVEEKEKTFFNHQTRCTIEKFIFSPHITITEKKMKEKIRIES
jgi:hypothetical protein